MSEGGLRLISGLARGLLAAVTAGLVVVGTAGCHAEPRFVENGRVPTRSAGPATPSAARTTVPTTAVPTTVTPGKVLCCDDPTTPPYVSVTVWAPEMSPTPVIIEEDVYYRNCTEAREAGVTPILRGEPGYRKGLDRDGDGRACD